MPRAGGRPGRARRGAGRRGAGRRVTRGGGSRADRVRRPAVPECPNTQARRQAADPGGRACWVRKLVCGRELPVRAAARLGTVTLPLPTAKVTWCCRNSPTSRCAARCKCSCCWFAATPPRTWRSWSYATSLPSSVAKPHAPGCSRLTGPCSPRSAACCRGPAGRASSSSPTRCCAGTGGWSPARGPPHTARLAGRSSTRRSNN
jgi:hypothetical protein